MFLLEQDPSPIRAAPGHHGRSLNGGRVDGDTQAAFRYRFLNSAHRGSTSASRIRKSRFRIDSQQTSAFHGHLFSTGPCCNSGWIPPAHRLPTPRFPARTSCLPGNQSSGKDSVTRQILLFSGEFHPLVLTK